MIRHSQIQTQDQKGTANKMFPIITSEDSIRAFKFHHGHCLYTGMWRNREFYKLVQTFSDKERDRAFALGCSLEQEGHAAVITAGDRAYRIWVEIGAKVPAEKVKLTITPQPAPEPNFEPSFCFA